MRIGKSIPQVVRECAISEQGLSPVRAEQLATCVNDLLQDVDWLTLDNGLTFDRGFDPIRASSGRTEREQGDAGAEFRRMTETVYCEQCGEPEAEIMLMHATLCLDCTTTTLREELENVFLYPICGQPLFSEDQLVAVCTIRYGTEHEHECPVRARRSGNSFPLHEVVV